MVPRIIVVVTTEVVSERLSFVSIGTINGFSSEAEVEAFGAVSSATDVEALLVQSKYVPLLLIEQDPVPGEGPVRIVLVAELCPATELNAASGFTKQATVATFGTAVTERVTARICCTVVTD